MRLDIAREILEKGRTIFGSGLVLGTWGNLSVRLPEDDLFLITPSGVDYLTLREKDLVVVDLHGQKREGTLKPSSETPLHALIYQRRSDVRAIVHTHSIYASAFAAAREKIPPVLEEVAQLVGGAVPCAHYLPAGTQELAAAAVDALGEGKAVLLANHGLVGVGLDLREALLITQVVEKAARVCLYAKLLGKPHCFTEEEARNLQQAFQEGYGQKNQEG